MPVVTIDWFEGRTAEQKKKVIEGITESLEKVGVPKEATWIVIRDMPKTNFGMGGKQASEG